MSDIPLSVLLGSLVFLLALSAFFSSSETGMMALNRYRLKHLAKQKHRGAMRAQRLLDQPDRLIGLILLGNNFINILATSIATVVAIRVVGEAGVAVAPFVLTPLVLIFAEVAPKTVAALYPERIAYPAAFVLEPLLKIFYPVVALTNWFANGFLRLFNIKRPEAGNEDLDPDELRIVVNEAGALISTRHRRMLLRLLDLESVTVNDIMVPRNEVNGIDLDDSADELLEQLMHSQHTRLPVYEGDIDQVVGMLHMRRVASLWEKDLLHVQWLREHCDTPYFIPSGTPLNTQLRNFQREQARVALVVDEYGDIEGLVTLEDLLEEVVGEFTTDPADHSIDVHPQDDGTFLIDGMANIRELNRAMRWELPTDGPKTLNGLVLEHLEAIPEPGTSLLIAGYPVEIVQATNNAVKTARIKPALRRPVVPSNEQT